MRSGHLRPSILKAKTKLWHQLEIDITDMHSGHLRLLILKTVCYGVRGRALASHTDVRGFEPQCGDNFKEVLICHVKVWSKSVLVFALHSL